MAATTFATLTSIENLTRANRIFLAAGNTPEQWLALTFDQLMFWAETAETPAAAAFLAAR